MEPQATPKKLLDQVRDALRLKHYSYRAEQAYVGWITRYVLFHDKRHPNDMGAPEAGAAATDAGALSARLRSVADRAGLCTLASPRDRDLGNPAAADTPALLDVCVSGYRPHQIVALGEPGAQPAAVPLLQERGQIEGRATAYVCLDFVCRTRCGKPASSGCWPRTGWLFLGRSGMAG